MPLTRFGSVGYSTPRISCDLRTSARASISLASGKANAPLDELAVWQKADIPCEPQHPEIRERISRTVLSFANAPDAAGTENAARAKLVKGPAGHGKHSHRTLANLITR